MRKRVLIVNNNTIYLEKIKKIFCNKNCEIVNFKKMNAFDLDLFTHFVLTGGNEPLDKEKFKDELSLIKATNKPLLGICCGYQLICLAFGSMIFKMKSPRKGMLKIKLVKEDPLFCDIDKEFLAYLNHTHSVENLGNELCGLGDSIDGTEIVKHSAKKIYGVQFHPEVNFDNLNIKKLVNNFLNLS